MLVYKFWEESKIMPRGKPWTPHEENDVLGQIANGIKRSRVKIPGRQDEAVRKHIFEMLKAGKVGPAGIRPWTWEEDGKLLMQLALEGREVRHVAIPGREPAAVESRIKYLRRKGWNIVLRPRPWSEEENLSLVRQVQEEGIPPRRARVENRTLTAVRDQVVLLRKQGKITRVFSDHAGHRVWTLAEKTRLRAVAPILGGNVAQKAKTIAEAEILPGRSREKIYSALRRDKTIRSAPENSAVAQAAKAP